jgi:hypothetical protein
LLRREVNYPRTTSPTSLFDRAVDVAKTALTVISPVKQILWRGQNPFKKVSVKTDSPISKVQYALPYMTCNIKLYNKLYEIK